MAGLSLLGALVGCGAAPDAPAAGDEVTGDTDALLINCGTRPNGPAMRGTWVSSRCRELDRVSASGATLRGASLTLGLVGTSLYGAQNGSLVATADLVGAKLEAYSSLSLPGVAVPLRIDAVRWVATGFAHHDYAIAAEVLPGDWKSVCGNQADGSPIMATILPGIWASDGSKSTASADFTAVCPGSSVYKCMVDAGYVPWFSRNECKGGTCVSRSLDMYHQACVRMLRADYCGDGASHTTAGTAVNGYDALGVQLDDSATTLFEAEWGPGGARCVRTPRHLLDPNHSLATVMDVLREECPSRVPADPSTCGGAASTYPAATGFTTPLAQRALIRSEVYPELAFHPFPAK